MIRPQFAGGGRSLRAALLGLALSAPILACGSASNDATPTDAAEAGKSEESVSNIVRVPSGPFFYGCIDKIDVACDSDERPSGKLTVPAFTIDRTEVTVAAYRRCVEAGACSTEGLNSEPACNWDQPGREQHPINCVELADARKYCEWAGQRVPSEHEWEKAARGTDGRMFSWGNIPIADAGRVANIADQSSEFDWKHVRYDDGFPTTAPVGSFPDGASPYGALDMIGNVWEWTDNEYTHQGGFVVRGCSYRSNHLVCRNSNRLWRPPGMTNAYFGFRCAG